MRYLVHHMLRDSAQRRADQEALVGGDCRLDYARAAERVASLGGGLQQLGVRRGDRIAIYLRPSVALPLAILGSSQAGGVFVPIHHGLFPDQVVHILRDSGAKALITDSGRWESLRDVLSTAPELDFGVVDGATTEATSHPVHDFEALCGASACDAKEVGIGRDLAAIL